MQNDSDLNYTLNRLVRGLGATQESIRRGYFGTLVVLLKVASVDVKRVFEVIDKELHVGGSSSKKVGINKYLKYVS